MGLNIKNDEVHAAVRELARVLGVSQTSAVEVAVRAKLAELEGRSDRGERERRLREAVAEAQAAYRGVDLWGVAEDLYDSETGLPR